MEDKTGSSTAGSKRPVKNEGFDPSPALICSIMTVLAAIGVAAGLQYHSPLVIIVFLMPAVIYEVIRTAGQSTKAASLIMLAALSLELVLIFFKVKFDLAKFLNMSSIYFQGTRLQLGEIKTLIPAAVALGSLVLLRNTRGIYTKWLSIIIIAGSIALIYSLAPGELTKFIQVGAKTLLRMFGGSF